MIIETEPFGLYGKAQPATPLRRWIAFAGALQGRDTDLGLPEVRLSFGPPAKTVMFGTRVPSGSTSWKGTPSNVWGVHSRKMSRSAPASSLRNMPLVLTVV